MELRGNVLLLMMLVVMFRGEYLMDVGGVTVMISIMTCYLAEAAHL